MQPRMTFDDFKKTSLHDSIMFHHILGEQTTLATSSDHETIKSVFGALRQYEPWIFIERLVRKDGKISLNVTFSLEYINEDLRDSRARMGLV